MSKHTAPMTDDYLAGLRRRNELRLHHARLQLGERWLLHPDNAVRRTRPSELAYRIGELAGHAVVIDYLPPGLYVQHVGRVSRQHSMMDGFNYQAVGREWRL